MVCMKMIGFNFLNGIIQDNRGQGSVEMILIIGGIIVIILLVVSMYESSYDYSDKKEYNMYVS